MTSRDFCYWLQGFFEIASTNGQLPGLTDKQAQMVQKHLALVFKHEIDPSYGDEKHQAELNEIHNPGVPKLSEKEIKDTLQETVNKLNEKVGKLEQRPTGYHPPPVFRC